MWYGKIVNDMSELSNFTAYYENQLQAAKQEVSINGRLELNIKELPAITETRFSQLQEIEAVLNYLNIQARIIRKEKYIEYERYKQKALSAREVEKYIDGEEDVVDFEVIINGIALLRNRYLGIMKGLEAKNFMMGHIKGLRTAGMEDIEL